MAAIRRMISTPQEKAVDLEALVLPVSEKTTDEFRRGVDAAESLAAAEFRVDAQGSDSD